MLKKEDSIAPHGGQLVDRTVPAEERDERLREAAELPKVTLGPRTISDLQMISTGVFSPLKGFMLREDYESVVEDMRLLDGLVWSLPVTLATGEETAQTLKEGSEVALVNGGGEPWPPCCSGSATATTRSARLRESTGPRIRITPV